MKCSLGISNFLEEISSLSHSAVFLYFFALIWGRLSYLSLLFFVTLHSNGCIFPFLLYFSLPFFSQLFVRPPQTAILLFWISFSWGWSFIKFVCVCVRVCTCLTLGAAQSALSFGSRENSEWVILKTPLVSEFRSTYLHDKDPALISKLQIIFMLKIYFPLCYENSSFFFFFYTLFPFFLSFSLDPLFLSLPLLPMYWQWNLNWSGIHQSICILNLVTAFWFFFLAVLLKY